MSTERFDASSNIIGSQVATAGTMRVEGTIISSEAQATAARTPGSFLLNNKHYQVQRQIASSGEAEVFLVEEGGRHQVLKYYFSHYKPKDEVIGRLQQIRRPDIIAPLDYGHHQDRFWEINEYMSGGTLGDVLPVKDLRRFKELVELVTEAIHACHSHQIIHRDIKPVNIFFRDATRREVVLGDFGIASPLQDGENYRVTTVARTTTYAAPELFTNIDNYTTLDNKVDYYALGISLLEAWIGDDPFKGISQFNIMRIKNEGRVFMPADIHPDIETLIKGLITTEPPKRWGYEEVKKWLRGEPVKVHYHTQEIQFKPYEFDQVQGIFVNDPKELAFHIERNPQKGARQLYSRSIGEWVQSASQDLYSELFEITEKAYPNTSQENMEAGIAKTIYLLDKDRPFKSYDGSEWYSPADLGMHIEQHAGYYKKELQKPSAKLYLFLEARGLQDRADKYRKYYTSQPEDRAFNLVALDLQDNILKFEGHTFENLQQLTNAPGDLQQRLINEIVDAHSKVSVWLDIAHNYLADNIHRWRSLQVYQPATLRYALKTGGFRIGDYEVFNEQEFYQLLEEQPELFTTDAQAAINCREADVWLVNYQQSSLLNLVTLHQFLQHAALSFQQMKILFGYLLEEGSTNDPFGCIEMLATDLQQVAGNDVSKLQQIVQTAQPACVRYMEKHKQTKVYATESLYDIVAAVSRIHKKYPSLGLQLLQALNDKIDRYIHEDFQNLRNNSEYFDLLMKHLQDFLTRSVAPISNQLPYYLHWEKEQQLIGKRSQVIDAQLDRELEKDKTEIRKKFDQYMATAIGNQVNYLDKGKAFYVIFVRCVGWAMALILLLSAIYSKGSIGWSIAVGIVILIVVRFLVNHVRRRRPNAGLGMIFDPLHKLMGKLLYRPIMKRLKADPNNPISRQALQPRDTELKKAEDINNGKRFNLQFEERVRIILLPHGQLETELATS